MRGIGKGCFRGVKYSMLADVIEYGAWKPMNSITSMCAMLATYGLWDVPGERYEPIVPASTAAAAPAGLMPARSITGISVEPTAAAQPAADGMAILTKKVIAVQTGTRKMPRPRIGAER